MPRKLDQTLADVPGIEVPEDEAPMTQDEATEQLALLGQALIATVGKKQEQQQVVAKLEGLLGGLKAKDFPDLAENPFVLQFLESMAQTRATNSDDPPGTIYNRGTIAVHSKPWTFENLKSPPPGWRPGEPLPENSVEWVYDYESDRTVPVTYNGLTVQFFAGQNWTGPKVFVDQLKESKRLDKVGFEHISYMFKSGPLPSDLGVLNEGTRRVRSASSAGGQGTGFRPGAGVSAQFWAGADGQPDGEAEGDAGSDDEAA